MIQQKKETIKSKARKEDNHQVIFRRENVSTYVNTGERKSIIQ